ncbi:MAG: tyrosine-type recombinase/integrase [Dehalococcoidales bacterium]|nr:tyrosine-type recombinase/integrase [Dehalococcoidales bacterium]
MNNHSSIGLHDLIEGFLFSISAEGKNPRTAECYSDKLHTLLKYAQEHKRPDSINLLDIQRFREFLSWTGSREIIQTNCHGGTYVRKARPSTAWFYYRALRRLFNWALESSPISSIRFKPPSPPPVQAYSREDLQKLLAVCDLDIKSGSFFTGIRNKAMLLLFIDAGIRRSELANLKMSDLDMDNRFVKVLGKGNKVGMAPFSAKTAKAIWAWTLERKKRAMADNLWITEEGTAFNIQGLVSWFARIKQRAGVSQTGGVHRLRHTAALAYLRQAKDSFLLQLFLRQSSLEMSRRYTQGLKAEEAIQAHRNRASPVEGLGLG